MKSTLSGSHAVGAVPGGAADGAVVDTKPYIQHHSRIGYVYQPNFMGTFPRPGGGTYELRTNAAGIRSNRDYAPTKPVGVRRWVVLGDSFAAGQYASNAERFSELLEKQVANLEIINLALEGTGTDQQLLLFEELGRNYQPDAVLIFPFLQNIRRNLVEYRTALQPDSGRTILQPKPRFVLEEGQLALRNVPVPTERPAADAATIAAQTDESANGWKRHVLKWPGMSALKRQLFRFIRWEPFPEYSRSNRPEWLLMAAILRQLQAACAPAPLIVVPVFYANYLQSNFARSYWTRFQELSAQADLQVIDLFPHFQTLGSESSRCFYEPFDCHFSPTGHRLVAEALKQELAARKLL